MTYLANDYFTDWEKALMGPRAAGYRKNQAPRVNIREEEGLFELESELPGMAEKDIEGKIEENILTIAARKNEEKEKEGVYLLRERRPYQFSRSFIIPRDVDKDQIDAVFARGLLTLTLKKSEKALPRQIEIKNA